MNLFDGLDDYVVFGILVIPSVSVQYGIGEFRYVTLSYLLMSTFMLYKMATNKERVEV